MLRLRAAARGGGRGALVQVHPKFPDAMDDFPVTSEIPRLLQVGIRPEFVGAPDIGRLLGRAEHDHRVAPEAVGPFKSAKDFKAIHPGHFQIEEGDNRVAA